MGIELGPFAVEHLEVLLDDADLLLLVGLVEVLQDDGDVHVDDDHEVDDDEGDEVDDGDEGEAAVPVGQVLEVRDMPSCDERLMAVLDGHQSFIAKQNIANILPKKIPSQ